MGYKMDITVVITCMTDIEIAYIEEAIGSVMCQGELLEVIVLLDLKSSVFDEVIEKYKGIVLFYKVEKGPLGAMRNLGASMAKSKWIAFLDADDVWLPNKLEKQIKFAETTGADLVGCDYYMISEGGGVFAVGLNDYIPAPSSWIVKSDLMKKLQFNEGSMIYEDMEWWANYASQKSRIKCRRLPDLLMMYRVRDGSLSVGAASAKRKRVIKKIAQSSSVIKFAVILCTYGAWYLKRKNYYNAGRKEIMPRSYEKN